MKIAQDVSLGWRHFWQALSAGPTYGFVLGFVLASSLFNTICRFILDLVRWLGST